MTSRLSFYDRWQLWRIRHQIWYWPATVASFNKRHGYEWSGTQWVPRADRLSDVVGATQPLAKIVPMDPESNWDICPVCLPWLAEQAAFPGILAMRSHHQAHKESDKSE